MKYKLVIKTKYKTYVRDRSKDKDLLLKKAISLSSKHPSWTCYVVADSVVIE